MQKSDALGQLRQFNLNVALDQLKEIFQIYYMKYCSKKRLECKKQNKILQHP